MFTTLKRMVNLAIITFLITCASAILFALEIAKIPKLSFQLQLMYYGAIITVPILFLLLLIGLRSAYTDLMAQNDVQYQEMAELRKRIEQLEKKADS